MKRARVAWAGASLALAIAACSGARVDRSTPIATTSAPVVSRAATGMPRPALARGEAARAANDACEACHADIAREWRASLHRDADVDPVYRRALAIEPLPFCRGCHAPEADPERDAPASLAEMGVGCVTCHVTSGDPERAPVLASSNASLDRATHALARDARFATNDACAGCHEFAFPGGDRGDVHDLMQSTIAEARDAPEGAATCASCHMPLVGSPERRHRAHDFTSSRSPESVRASVDVTASRAGDSVTITLRPRGLGHAAPTGDLFRRVEVLAEAIGADRMVLARDVKFLARHFERGPGAMARRRLRDDDRPGRHGREPVVVRFDLGASARSRAIAWRVAYQRVEHPNGVDERDALVESEIVLGEGELSP